MNKKEFIAKYGKTKYNIMREKSRVAVHDRNRKGGRRYKEMREYENTGLRCERGSVRRRDGRNWLQYKKIIAPDSQLHHCWLPKSAKYNGVALVEADAHMHGHIKVIKY